MTQQFNPNTLKLNRPELELKLMISPIETKAISLVQTT